MNNNELNDRIQRKKVDDAEKRGFTQGLAYAVAQLIRTNELSLAQYLLSESGLRLEDFKRAGVDPYDLQPIREMLNGMESTSAEARAFLSKNVKP